MRYYRGIRFDNKINYQPTTQEMTELAKGWNEVEANIKGFIRARNDNDKLQYLSVIDEDLDWLIRQAQKTKTEIRKIW